MNNETTKPEASKESGGRVDSVVMCDRKAIGLKDMDGRDIYTGDIVEFYFCSDKGHSKEPNDNYTRMRDLVEEIDGDFYFTCSFGRAFAWRHNEYCRVIGNDKSLIDT